MDIYLCNITLTQKIGCGDKDPIIPLISGDIVIFVMFAFENMCNMV